MIAGDETYISELFKNKNMEGLQGKRNMEEDFKVSEYGRRFTMLAKDRRRFTMLAKYRRRFTRSKKYRKQIAEYRRRDFEWVIRACDNPKRSVKQEKKKRGRSEK